MQLYTHSRFNKPLGIWVTGEFLAHVCFGRNLLETARNVTFTGAIPLYVACRTQAGTGVIRVKVAAPSRMVVLGFGWL